MRTIQLSIDGMSCRRCVRQATALLRDVPGLITVTADSKNGRVTITGELSDDDVLDSLAGTRFTARITEATPHPQPVSDDRGPPTSPRTS